MGSLDERLRRSPDTNTPTIDTDKSTDTETRRRVPSRAKLLGSAVGAREAIILAFPAFAGAQDTPPASATPANEGVPNTPVQVDQPSETRAVTATTARYDDKTTWPTIPPENKEAWPTWGYFARSPWSGETSDQLKIISETPRTPATGTLHMPETYGTKRVYEYTLTNYNVAACGKMNTARGGNGSKESVGIAYKLRPSVIKTKKGRFARLKIGLADMQFSNAKTSTGNHYKFNHSCEKVATNTSVKVNLVKRIGRTSFKVIRSLPTSKDITLKNPGFKGYEYIDRLYGTQLIPDRNRGLNKGLKNSQLEWSTVKFPINAKNIGQYAFKVSVTSRPRDEISCDDLEQTQPGVYSTYVNCSRDYWPKSVHTEKASRIVTIRR